MLVKAPFIRTDRIIESSSGIFSLLLETSFTGKEDRHNETLTDSLTRVVLADTKLVFISLLSDSYSNCNKQVLTLLQSASRFIDQRGKWRWEQSQGQYNHQGTVNLCRLERNSALVVSHDSGVKFSFICIHKGKKKEG